MPQTITCTITNSAGAVIPELNVRAYALQPGSETLLAEGVSNKKGECRLTYEWSGGKALHVQVRAYAFDGTLLGVSEVMYKAKPAEVLKFSAEEPGSISEYERIDIALRYMLPGQILQEKDIQLLVHSLAEFKGQIPSLYLNSLKESNLQFWINSNMLADQSQLPPALFYGISRIKGVNITLNDILEIPDQELTTFLSQAIQRGFIPTLDLQQLQRHLHRVRKSQVEMISSTLAGRINDVRNGDPLAHLGVRIYRVGDNSELLGEDLSGTDGRFYISLEMAKREIVSYRLAIYRQEELVFQEERILEETPLSISLDLPPAPDTSPRLNTMTGIDDVITGNVVQNLNREGIHSLRDLRIRPDVLDSLPVETATRLKGYAQLNLLDNLAPAKVKSFLDAGYTSLGQLAQASRTEVIRRLGQAQGIFQSSKVWHQAKIASAVIDGITVDVPSSPVFDPGNPPDQPNPFQDILELIPENCGCTSCEDAVSRTAYLADLLGYALQKVKINENFVTLSDLETNFFQPFGDMPSSCDFQREQVRQICICIEVLHGYLNTKSLPAPGSTAEEILHNAYLEYLLEAYSQILFGLGTSYQELRDIRVPDNDEDESKAKLLQRLGIPEIVSGTETLNAIYLAPESITEEDLERLFGLRNTKRPPLTSIPEKPWLLQWRELQLRSSWEAADHGSDNRPLGNLPILDPDLISLDYLIDGLAGPASILWHARRGQIEAEFLRLQEIQRNAPDDLTAWQGVFPADTGWENLEGVLPQKALDYLIGMKKLIDEGSAVTEQEWTSIINIGVLYYKKSIYAQWLEAEADPVNNIVFGPDQFKIPEISFEFPAQQTTAPIPEWRADEADLRTWRLLLMSRIELTKEAEQSLKKSVTTAEELTLIRLREALIHASDAPGTSLSEKGDWITEHLLIDAKAASCQMTTRIQQAAEILQLLLWSLRSGQLRDTHPDWHLEDDEFDEKWTWLKQYNTWRAAMLVHLYPENLLQPSLRRHATAAFRNLVEETRRQSQLAPADACRVASAYTEFFNDVTHLEPVAMVKAKTRVYEDGCQRKPFKGDETHIYQFARSRISGRVYWSRYRAFHFSNEPQNDWAAVPDLQQTVQVVGAVYYDISTLERYVYLFAKVQGSLRQELVYKRYDLLQDEWEAGFNSLDLPEEAPSFQAVVKQRNQEDQAPHLAIFLPRKGIYSCPMNRTGDPWDEENRNLIVDRPTGQYIEVLHDMIAESPTGYYLFARLKIFQTKKLQVHYRLFGQHDDGLWRRLDHSNFESWKGGFPWHQDGTTYAFTGRYSYIVKRTELLPFDISVYGLELWIGNRTGKYLYEIKDIYFNEFYYNLSALLQLTYDKAPDRSKEIAGWAKSKWEEQKREILKAEFEKLEVEEVEEHYGSEWLFASQLVRSITVNHWDLGQLLKKAYIDEIENIKAYQRNLYEDEVGTRYGAKEGLRKIYGYTGWPPTHPPTIHVFYEIYFDSQSDPEKLERRGLFRALQKGPDLLRDLHTLRAAPLSVEGFDIRQKLSPAEMTLRKLMIQEALTLLSGSPSDVLTYYREAFYFVPIQLGLQLQKQGHYLAALDWFRTVYDYTADPDQRKIYYGLIEEESITGGLGRKGDWLLDPLNPHFIAETRANTYTRFTLLTIIRCLIDYANAEFSRYTSESLPTARTLYVAALKLLELPELLLQGDICEQLLQTLDDLEIEGLVADYRGQWESLKNEMLRLRTASRILEAKETVREMMRGNAAVEDRLLRSRTFVREKIASLPPEPALKQRLQSRVIKTSTIQNRLLQIAEVEKTILKTTLKAGQEWSDRIAVLAGTSIESLEIEAVNLEWLANGSDTKKEALLRTGQAAILAEILLPSFDFCIQDNPVIKAWKLETELNLYKLRTCRDIAGLERSSLIIDESLDANTLPSIGNRGDIAVPGKIQLPPTPYRYAVLIERAKQLANMAQQMESYFLSALEKRDAEMYQRLKAGQEVELTKAGVRLNQLKVSEAEDGVVLAELQRDRASIQEEHYQELLSEGISDLEHSAVHLLESVAAYQYVSSALRFTAGSTPSLLSILGFGSNNISNVAAGFEQLAAAIRTTSEILSIYSNYERRKQDWILARNLARQDVRIGNQQVRLSQDRLRIVNQEHHISELQADHARETLDFLVNKFTNADLYDWMSGILEGVYGSFLQQATAVAQLAPRAGSKTRRLRQRFSEEEVSARCM